jgi:hypothetical protein
MNKWNKQTKKENTTIVVVYVRRNPCLRVYLLPVKKAVEGQCEEYYHLGQPRRLASTPTYWW